MVKAEVIDDLERRKGDDAVGAGSNGMSGEPIAIVGMACKFPGAEDLDAFWRLLVEGKNAVVENAPGPGEGRFAEIFGDTIIENDACRFGAFVDDIDKFDAGFFRISPVEADLLDPQQRMMLEMCWLALEDAGINPDRLKGTNTGVYSGISNDEYRMLVLETTRPTEAAGSLYALSGTNLNGTAGRVSFVLGLNGPAKAVDAACASALVAVHDAVSDLQQGKADLALAGGVQAILNGRIYELRAEAMMLSQEGQCKTFDASADGYVRGEGCGVVALKRLSDAEADGDRIWAVIRGASVNHGGASAGLTVPHAPAMEKLIEAAHADAGVPASEVDYLETHGTGTAVGDPIEVEAVAKVYGRGREADRPLLMGSVKTNVGHLESAAGIAGLIKAALAVERGVIPKHLHFTNPNPRVDWDEVPLQVTTEMIDWPNRPGRPRLAGVNSFGISGTNAHIVLEEHCANGDNVDIRNGTMGSAQAVEVSLPKPLIESVEPSDVFDGRDKRFLPLSGKTDNAVKDLARRYVSWIDANGLEIDADGVNDAKLADMSWTAGVGRSHFDRRSSVVFGDGASLRQQLTDLAERDLELEPRRPAKVAFVYTGQGSQWVGMGEALYRQEPVARAVFDRCEAVFRKERGGSLLDVMWGRNGADEDLGDTAWEQPALYALGCALTALWESVGVRPDVVLGHSVGEIAASYAAGVFSLEDGMRFAAVRGTLLSETEPGTMAAIFASPNEVTSAIEELNAASDGVGLSIAGDNGAHQVVSGPVVEIEKIVDRFEAEGVRARRLNTAKAFHSALVEPALDALGEFVDALSVKSPDLSVVSNLTGRVVEPDMALDGSYWRRHAREAVAFANGVSSMAELGVDLVVEIGPHAVLGPMTTLAWPTSSGGQQPSRAPVAIASLRRPPRDASSAEPESGFVDAVAEAYEAGLEISFEGLCAGEERRRISLPSYPFQRERHWIDQSKKRRLSAGHPLLGVKHESARGEIAYETEVFPSEPVWLNDHRVFNRLVAPGALYGAMVASTALDEGNGSVVVEDFQLHSPMVFAAKKPDDDEGEEGRTMQVVLDESDGASTRSVQVYSKANSGNWTLHVEGGVSEGDPLAVPVERIDLNGLKSRLSESDVGDYYRAKSDTGIDLGPLFRTLGLVWTGPGEALGEVILPEVLGRNELDVHPLILDGCFQVVGMARNMTGEAGEPTYLPFGWERLWLNRSLPDQVLCHVQMSEAARESGSGSPEVLSGEIRIYDLDGGLIGGISGYTVKKATREALLSAVEEVDDLLYEVVWRDKELESGIVSADFFPQPRDVAAGTELFPDYLSTAGVDPEGRNGLLTDLELWSRSYALRTLEKLGWERRVGEVVEPEELRERLGVTGEHSRLFRRLLEMLDSAGVVEETDDGFAVVLGDGNPLPSELPSNPEGYAAEMARRYSHGLTEVGLFERSGGALADVLRGDADPLTLLFSSGEPTAADLYLKAPVARAANRLLADAVQKLVADLPEGRRLRVIEVGAGTGSATASVLPVLPEGQFDYVYTDISAGFFAEAEARFGDANGSIEYRSLDIEKDPIVQGFDSHGFDLMIASNVLHATRSLEETLTHCRALLAPSGQLVALENLRGLGWMDLTFGQLDGWWRFADEYRPHHALASPAVWRQALSDAGFEETEVLGVDDSFTHDMLDKGVIVSQGPSEVTESEGVWVITRDAGGVAEGIANELTGRNQKVVLVGAEGVADVQFAADGPNVLDSALEVEDRESWSVLLEHLIGDLPLNGVIHTLSLDGHGPEASTDDMARDVRRAGASALAMVQGLTESDAVPAKGVWFVTRGAQVLERERGGGLSGSILWGLGKVANLEAGHLNPRMIDLDPIVPIAPSDLADDLLYPDGENHIAYRTGRRLAARLVRSDAAGKRLALPEDSDWVLAPDQAGVFENPQIKRLTRRSLEPWEVRVTVEGTGLNFWDVFRSLGFIEEGDLGRELSGQVIETGSEVTSVNVSDRVVGLGFGAFAPEMITHGELVALAPEGFSVSDLATIPSAFVSAALSYELSGLDVGDRVLIHAGSGGVGLAAIQLAQAAGAEVFATASAPKQAYLKSLGVKHIFDSRTTHFGEEINEATGGQGVDVVLNSLTSEGFIDASLDCLAQGGRFIELARRDILSVEDMASIRPDVSYDILELDVLKKTEPEWVGRVLRDVMKGISSGELKPIAHSRWPLAEAGAALGFMRSARHIGKIVLTPPPLNQGRLRSDRTYLVTGGLGGIGIAVAEWLANHGAGTIVLNGRRAPDAEAEEAIESLRTEGVRVEVELADVTETSAIDAMLERVDASCPPLGGVIHSVGVLSDAALPNQTWESFERVLWPKIVGGWHLHRATLDRDLDMFVLFSSRVGVMGNPGQSNHAAANAFLDQLAGHRRAMGLPGQAIAWGAWSEIGEAAEQKERIEERRAALGGRWFTPEQGIRALETLVRQDKTTSVVMSMDWSVFEEAVQDRPPFLEDLLSSPDDDGSADAVADEDVLTRLRSVPQGERDEVLISFLQHELQAVLRLSAPPSPTVGFFDLGMDSLMAVELRNRLNRALAGEYVASNTIVFDYPNVAEMARHLSEELADLSEEKQVFSIQVAPAADDEPEEEPRLPTDVDGIAIVGMACRFPGADNLDEFWRLLEVGSDAITDGRQDGGSWRDVVGDPYAEREVLRKGAFIDHVDEFDSRFFRISPIEARLMDPQQRMMLETAWHALEDAGIDPERLKGSRTGVYVGVGSSEYRDVIAASGFPDNYLGTTSSMAVGRLAFALGLEGPAIPVDLVCASSHASIHQAVQSLDSGEIDMAITGGVNAVLSVPITEYMTDLTMLSRSVRSRPFDADADGFVRGEGCGMLVLKRLRDAEADGDRIWGVILGSAVNQNGASAGLTVPNGSAQQRVMQDAVKVAGINPGDVDYYEAHGGASQLGDPIELHAAGAVYGENREDDHAMLVGSVKANVGHLERAAGVASVIKVALSMKNGVIPRQVNFDEPNPHIDWDRLPLRVPTENVEWTVPPQRHRMAAVSGFGMSGANAHLLLADYGGTNGEAAKGNGFRAPTGSEQEVGQDFTDRISGLTNEVRETQERATRLLPLSGKSELALQDLSARYLDWVDNHSSNENGDLGSSFADMTWTAGVGRSHFEHRKAIVFSDAEALRQGLRSAASAQEETVNRPSDTPPRVAFVYSGGLPSWSRSIGELYEGEPVVRAVMDRCDEMFASDSSDGLLDGLLPTNGSEAPPDDQAWAYAAVYAIECAMTALWESVGVIPSLVIGSAVGEIASAYAAGVVSLEDGLKLAARLGRLSQSTSGEVAAEEIYAVVASVELTEPRISMLSGATGLRVAGSELRNGEYWRSHSIKLEPADLAVKSLADHDVGVIIGIGMNSDEASKLTDTPRRSDDNSASVNRSLEVVPCAGDSRFIDAVAHAYEAGLPIRFEGLFAGESRRRIALPHYPFQRRRHWV